MKNQCLMILIFAFIFISCCSGNINNKINIPYNELIEYHGYSGVEDLRIYDLGNLNKSKYESFNMSFILTNKTEEDLYIYSVNTCCTCTIVYLEDQEGNKTSKFSKYPTGEVADIIIKPGNFVYIYVELDISEEPLGEGYKSVYLYNDFFDLILNIELDYNITE